MRIGIRAHDIGSYPFEELVKTIHEQGFSCTHLALYKAITDFPIDNGALTPGLAMYVKNTFQKYDVDIAVLGCYKNLANPDPVQLQEIIETYKAHIRFASLIGAGVVGTETGAVNTKYQYEPANHSPEALQIFINNLKPIVEYAEKFGVILAIEPVWKHIVCDSKRMKTVFDEINSPNLQAIFDPVNVLYEGNYTDQAEVIQEAFDLYGEQIAILHAKDFVIENGVMRSVPSGEGNLNYDLIMKYIKKHKPFMHVTLEDTVAGQAKTAKSYVETKYQQA